MQQTAALAYSNDAGPRLDPMSPEERSRHMRRVRSKDTKPELIVRRIVEKLGYEPDLNVNSLPGRPDLVFTTLRKVIFVHGCYWHLHEPCGHYSLPRTRQEFWLPKLEGNRERDKKNIATLQEMGWAVLIIWQCELRDEMATAACIRSFLDRSVY